MHRRHFETKADFLGGVKAWVAATWEQHGKPDPATWTLETTHMELDHATMRLEIDVQALNEKFHASVNAIDMMLEDFDAKKHGRPH